MQSTSIKTSNLTRYTEQTIPSADRQTMINKRNAMYLAFLTEFYEEFTSVRTNNAVERSILLIKNPHKPVAVFDNMFTLTMFVKNFVLFICDSHDNTNVICKVDLNALTLVDARNEIAARIRSAVAQSAITNLFKIEVLNDSEMHTSHSYYSKSDENADYFSYDNPRLFFKESHAIDVLNRIKTKYPALELNVV